MAIQDTQLLDLPEENIRFILSKLSMKTLTISSCVRRKWLHIIRDISFSKFYIKLNSEQKTLRSRLMVTTSTGIHTLSLLDLRGVYDSSDSSSNGRRLHCPFDEAGCSVKLLGTSNGLVFAALNSYKNFYIWNPSTGFNLKLLNPEEFEGMKECHLSDHHSGFGYVSATDDYKAFVTICRESNLWVLVYSVKSQTWTKIESPYNFLLLENTYSSNKEGILVNEKLHWLHRYTPVGPRVGLRGRYAVKYPDGFADELKEELKVLGLLVFDLAENNFRKIPFPAAVFADDDKKRSYHNLIGVSDGCLSLMRYMGQSIDFWVMRKYDVSESWTRLFRLNIYKRPHERIIRYHHPLLIMGTNILIKARFSQEDRLIRIDMEQDDPPEAYFEKPGFAFHTTLVYQETPVFLEKQKVNTEKVSEKQNDLSKKRKCRT